MEVFINAIAERKVISSLFQYLNTIKLPATTVALDAKKYFGLILTSNLKKQIYWPVL